MWYTIGGVVLAAAILYYYIAVKPKKDEREGRD